MYLKLDKETKYNYAMAWENGRSTNQFMRNWIHMKI